MKYFSHSFKMLMLIKHCKAKGESEIEGCRTINCQRCIFPFKYNGVEHEKCITVDSENGAPWCAVDVREKFKKIINLDLFNSCRKMERQLTERGRIVTSVMTLVRWKIMEENLSRSVQYWHFSVSLKSIISNKIFYFVT